jgi:DNA-binding MarR family transcriptional regulator
MKMDIRTLKDGNWAWFNKQIFEDTRLRPIDKLVYLGLTYFANNETQACFPSILKLQEITGLSRRSIIKAINRLEELGYIRIERHQGRSSTYYLLDIHQCTICTSARYAPVHDMHQCTTCTGVVHHMHGGGAPGARGWCTWCTHNNNYITRINNNTYLTKKEQANFEKLNFKDKNFLEEPLKENLNAPTKNNAPTNNLKKDGATLCKIKDNLEPVSNILNNLLSPKEKSLLDKIEKYKVENIEERLKILNEQAEKLCKKENANGYGS